MGYTHYFPQNRSFSDTEWANLTEAVQKVFKYGTCPPLCEEYDDPNTEPVISNTEIRFNGVEDDSYETFYLPRNKTGDFQFCKTANKPYDAAVVAVLCLAETLANGVLDIGSDGNHEDWLAGIRLAAMATNLKINCPIFKET